MVSNIKCLIESGNLKKVNFLIEKINLANPQFFRIFKEKALYELIFLGMPNEHIGFEIMEKYEETIVKFVRSLTLFKKGENFINFLDAYLK